MPERPDLSEFVDKVRFARTVTSCHDAVEALRPELEELLARRVQNEILASEIAKTAIACGVINDQPLTGPQLLLVANDTRAYIAALQAFVRRVADYSNDGWLAREAVDLLGGTP